MNNSKHLTGCHLILLVALALLIGFGNNNALAQKLYLGDAGDNSVKVVDLDLDNKTGNVDTLVTPGSGGLSGPRGILFAGKSLLVSNQNIATGKPEIAGEILSFNRMTGEFQGAFVPSSDKNAPWLPQGIILGNQPGEAYLYVANLTTAQGSSPGTISTYDVNGKFLAELDAKGFSNKEFHARAAVFGPDDLLYVSMRTLKKDGLGGWVLRFNADGSFHDVFISDQGGLGHLNRPEGLVFDPDGNLYITSFRANTGDTDSIRIYNSTGTYLNSIDLDQVGGARTYAQSLIFGPDDNLFVPILNTGELRSYDINNNYAETVYALSPANQLLNPWYLIFENTDSHTLDYRATSLVF